jgi:hypothetical protein
MTIVRSLDAASDIIFTTGTGGLDGVTHGTVAVLFKPLPLYDGAARTLFRLHDSAGLDLGGIGLNASDEVVWSDGTTESAGPVTTAGDWHALVARKVTGSATPRFSLLNVTTGIPAHADGDAAVGNWTAPTGGSIRMAIEGAVGPGSYVAAMGAWADELPWTADSFGDDDIEAALLEEHLDYWLAAAPSAAWGFGQPSDHNVEDVTGGRADQITFGGGGAVSAADLDFQYEDTGLFVFSKNFYRTTQTEPFTGGIVRDLSETQGTPTTLTSANVSGGFTEVFRFQREVGTAVGSSTISTQLQVTAVSAATLSYRWRVQRWNSSGVLQASSSYSSEQNTVGIKVQSFELATTWSAGDILAVSVELRKASGGGSRNITIAVNDPDSWAEFEVAVFSPAQVTANLPLAVAVAPTVATDRVVTADIPLTVALAGTVQAPSDTGLISGTVSANPVTLSCGVGERLICIAFSRGGGTGFAVTPNAGGASWINRVAEATLPGNDLARRSLGVAELVPTSGITDGLFTAAWSADSTDAIWLRVQEGGAFGFAAAATADSDTGSVTSLATGDTASIPAGDLLLLAAAAIRDGGAAGIGWAATDVNPGLVAGGNLLLDAYAGKGAGGNAGAGGYLILDSQPAGVRADTVSLPGGDAGKRITAALVVWSTGVTAAAQVTANIPLSIAVAGTTEAEHQVTAGVELGVALAGTATAQHQATAEVDLTVALAGTVATDHTVAAAVPLALAVAPVVDAPEVGAPAQVTASIPLTLALTGTAQATHQVTTAVPLAVATAGTVHAEHQATTTLPLTVTLAPVVDAPVPGAPNQVTAGIPLTLALTGTTTTGYQVTAGIPLTLALIPAVATDRAVTVGIVLGLTLAAASASAPPATPVTSSRPSGWQGVLTARELWTIIRVDQPETACPNDGEPLRTGPRGVLYCPFDGYRPERGW